MGDRLGDHLEDQLETLGDQDGSKNMDFQRSWGSVLELFLESFLEQKSGCQRLRFEMCDIPGGGDGQWAALYSFAVVKLLSSRG